MIIIIQMLCVKKDFFFFEQKKSVKYKRMKKIIELKGAFIQKKTGIINNNFKIHVNNV